MCVKVYSGRDRPGTLYLRSLYPDYAHTSLPRPAQISTSIILRINLPSTSDGYTWLSSQARTRGRGMQPDFALGYCIGLIVGEGTFTASSGYPCATVRMKNDREPLLALQRQFGGNVYGPYSDGMSQWMLFGMPLRDQVAAFDAHLPPSRKRDQFLVWCDRWAEYFARPDHMWSRNWSLKPKLFVQSNETPGPSGQQ